METPLVRSLTDQYDRLWLSMRDALTKCPDDLWRKSDVDWLIPARLAYHAIQACDFYSRPTRDFNWNNLQSNWETSPPDQLPSRQKILDYQAHVAQQVKAWLLDLGDTGLLTEETVFIWTGALILDRAIYSLRHAQHHLGQLNAELRRHNLPRGEWA